MNKQQWCFSQLWYLSNHAYAIHDQRTQVRIQLPTKDPTLCHMCLFYRQRKDEAHPWEIPLRPSKMKPMHRDNGFNRSQQLPRRVIRIRTTAHQAINSVLLSVSTSRTILAVVNYIKSQTSGEGMAKTIWIHPKEPHIMNNTVVTPSKRQMT